MIFMKNIINKILVICGIAFVVWLAASWIDTNQHNNPFEEGYGDFASWNIIRLEEIIK